MNESKVSSRYKCTQPIYIHDVGGLCSGNSHHQLSSSSVVTLAEPANRSQVTTVTVSVFRLSSHGNPSESAKIMQIYVQIFQEFIGLLFMDD